MEGSDLAGAKRPRRKNEGGRKAEVLSSYVRIGSELTIWPSSCVRSEQGRGRRKEEGRGRRKEGAGGKRPRTKKKEERVFQIIGSELTIWPSSCVRINCSILFHNLLIM